LYTIIIYDFRRKCKSEFHPGRPGKKNFPANRRIFDVPDVPIVPAGVRKKKNARKNRFFSDFFIIPLASRRAMWYNNERV
jgi:hypothetical protein